ncbi:MAG: M3 family oligoendopeptidase [Bacteroidota bacterium]|nr:M3 family oligoendopeptidase [Bacteroidota bacterium]
MTRKFIPADFEISNWENLKPWFENLLNREIHSSESLRKWLIDRSELESIVSENMGWRYIRMTCDTTNETLSNAYNYFVTEIEPNIQPFTNKLDEKLLQSPFVNDLSSDADQILVKSVKSHFEIFREENIPLQTEMQQLQVKYGAIVGGLTVKVDSEEITLQKASTYLFKTDRTIREKVWFEIQNKRLSAKSDLDLLFNDLVGLRDRVAANAGFGNFRDYMFKELCRFDYTPKDCFTFHEAIKSEVVPLLNELAKDRKQKLNLEALKPWDLSVDKQNHPPLKPFDGAKQLVDKTFKSFSKIDPKVGEVITTMDKMKHLDLESRKGKAPGGYNYPLYENGIPFIFMNSVGSVRDLVTMVHEGGHALHSILTKDLELVSYKNLPSEVAELASMGMELISMEHWDVFFDNKEELNRAKRDHLEQIIDTLPWVAIIDKFQHWIYENPSHTTEERCAQWVIIYNEFTTSEVDWKGLEKFKENIWQKQLHLYEVPFYYIEYGMAQLGAIAVWKNYKENPQKGLNQYLAALQLGYTKSIHEIYKTAGIKFDFSAGYIKELMGFVKKELANLHS